jgi:hypothetical protein
MKKPHDYHTVIENIRDIILRLIGPDGVSFEGILARAAHAGCPSEGQVRTILNGLVLEEAIHLDGMVYYPRDPVGPDPFLPPSVDLAPEPIVVISATSSIKRSTVDPREREFLAALDELISLRLIRITADGHLAANHFPKKSGKILVVK